MSVIADPMGEECDVASATAELERAQTVATKIDALENRAAWLDEEFRVPFTNIRIGVASIISFLPGIGDSVALMLSASIVYEGMRLGAPTLTLAWMSFIVLVEGIVGVIPVLGDVIGLLWTANVNNVGRLRTHQAEMDGSVNWWFVLLLFSPVILFIFGVMRFL